jgi:hypothetical protein
LALSYGGEGEGEATAESNIETHPRLPTVGVVLLLEEATRHVREEEVQAPS